MAETLNERWAKFDILVKAAAGILLPIIIFTVGAWYTSVQQRSASDRLTHDKEAENEQRKTDRAANLIKSLSSDNKRERLLALSLIQHLSSEQLTEEIRDALVTAAFTDDDPRVAATATTAVSNALRVDPKLAQTVQQVARTNSNQRSTASTNPQLNETLANIAVNGQGEDRKMASDALKVLNNNAFNLHGYDHQSVQVRIGATGTSAMVSYSLNGSTNSMKGDSISFVLDKAHNNPNILALFFDFSNSQGGQYEVTVVDTKSGKTVSTYTIKQAGGLTTAITYTFEID